MTNRPLRSTIRRTELLWLLILPLPGLAQEPEVMLITEDTLLQRGAVYRQRIVLGADGVSLDGNGATLIGPGRPGEADSHVGPGIEARGLKAVTLRNLRVRGFAQGLLAEDAEGWVVEGNDFSDNYHDPGFGWGEQPRRGGMVVTRMTKSVIRRNRANRVWNGLDLAGSHDNLIEENDLSRCSNTCLKLWDSARNCVRENDLSYGIRIQPGEVHARDSTGLLLESGSDQNLFYRNDITHGGDGIFVRVLNGWISTGNLFVENDCSFANNNCVESWSPGNTWIRNRANHGSYGFWLGGSDQTRLIGNEAAWNGLPAGSHQAPEPGFGHGGIVLVGGSSSHTLIDGNHCHHNNGAGIAFRGDVESEGRRWRTHHWVVQNNLLEHNRFGLWGRWGDWIHLGNNVFRENAEGNLLEEVTRLLDGGRDQTVTRAPQVAWRAPERVLVGSLATFDASGSRDPGGLPLSFSWSLGGREATGEVVEHVFEAPGFYRVGVTASNGILADLAFRDLLAIEPRVVEVGTEGEAGRWGFEMEGNTDGKGRVSFADDPEALVGSTSLCFTPDPYKGLYVSAVFPKSRDARWDLRGRKRLTFWLRTRNPNIPGFQEPGPVVRLLGPEGEICLQPAGGRNLLVGLPYSEARWTWMRVAVPLAGDEEWSRETHGELDLGAVGALSLSLDSWGGEPFTIWLDGLTWE